MQSHLSYFITYLTAHRSLKHNFLVVVGSVFKFGGLGEKHKEKISSVKVKEYPNINQQLGVELKI